MASFFQPPKSTNTSATKTRWTPRTAPSPWHPATAPQPEMLTAPRKWLRFFSRRNRRIHPPQRRSRRRAQHRRNGIRLPRRNLKCAPRPANGFGFSTAENRRIHSPQRRFRRRAPDRHHGIRPTRRSLKCSPPPRNGFVFSAGLLSRLYRRNRGGFLSRDQRERSLECVTELLKRRTYRPGMLGIFILTGSPLICEVSCSSTFCNSMLASLEIILTSPYGETLVETHTSAFLPSAEVDV